MAMKGQKTVYEWRLNFVDEYGDIEHIDFFDTYAEAAKWLKHYENDGASEIELQRTVIDAAESVEDIFYATVVDGKLPEYFDDCSVRVTAAHHAEVAWAHKAA